MFICRWKLVWDQNKDIKVTSRTLKMSNSWYAEKYIYIKNKQGPVEVQK